VKLVSGWEDVSVPGLTADLFVSLDGFARGVDVGPFFGYSGPELDRWVHENLEQPQVMVMGRVTYEVLWEISSAATDEGSRRMNDLPKVVFSNTLAEPLAWPNSRLVRGDLAEGIRTLKQQSGDPLRSIGSLSLVRSMILLGLVDLLRVAVFPVVLGTVGREPAYPGYPQTHLELAATTVLDSRIVMLEYRPAGGTRS
jgi:dihydrofolate reductase